MIPFSPRSLAGAALAASLGACALIAPGSFPLGTSLDEVQHSSARPTGDYALPGGGRRLEFALGSFGKQTYMLDFDASGQLVARQQVLSEANLSRIVPGMSQQDVLLNYGRPVKIDFVGRQHLKVWSYRYADGDCEWYQVSVSDAGSVLQANKAWDPRLRRSERPRLMARVLYGIPNCDTVRKARAWLAERGIEAQFHDFKKSGVPPERLDAWLDVLGWEVLLNRKGTTWRRLDDADRAAVADRASARDLMLAQPSVIRRPVVEWGGADISAGFDPAAWAARV